MPDSSSRPPVTETNPHIEVIHGISVSDSYRWLEDGTSPRTRDWLEQQTAYSCNYLKNIRGRGRIESRVRELLDVETYDSLICAGHRYVFRKRLPGEEQPRIYVRDGISGPDRVLLEPSNCGAGIYTAIKPVALSNNGEILAYEVKEGGEQTSRVELLSLITGCRLPDALPHGYLRAFAFAPDSLSFYYCVEAIHPAESFAPVLRQHRLGETAEQDRIIFHAGTANNVRIGLISGPKSQLIFVQKILDRVLVDCYLRSHDETDLATLILRDIDYMFAPQFSGDRILALTDFQAPNRRVVELRVDTSGDHEFVELVPSEQAMVQQWTVVDGHMVLSYVYGTSQKMSVFDLFGEPLGDVRLPEASTARLITGCVLTDDVMITIESFFDSPSIHSYSIASKELRAWSPQATSLDSTIYGEQQVRYQSKDGTEIPMYLVGRRAALAKQRNIVILTSYGGFGVAMTPQFSVLVAFLMEQGCVFALPCIRGGSEFGVAWHLAARRRNRQKAFDDFLAAARWLVVNGLASPKEIGIFGGSNSGLLVGAAMTQAPDLFRAVVCIAPLLDMVRYHLFDGASKWLEEFGTAEDPDDFAALLDLSPYHRIEDNVLYPAMMMISGDSDQKCNPLHARKMVARLQAANISNHPIILDYSKYRGHSPVLPLSVRTSALTDRVAFLCDQLGVSNRTRPVMHFLFLKAYAKLLFFDFLLLRGNFNVLHQKVQRCPITEMPVAPDTIERICTAIDMACIWYRKEVLCLQRSAATACLLKSYGIAAVMVTGVQQLPFKSHAWVEVDGKVVNDKPYVNEMYSVLDRC